MGLMSKIAVGVGAIATSIAGSSTSKLHSNWQRGQHREHRASVERMERRERWSNRGGRKTQR